MTIFVKLAIVIAGIATIYLSNAVILGSVLSMGPAIFAVSAIAIALVLGVIWGYVGWITFFVDFWDLDNQLLRFGSVTIAVSLLAAAAVFCHLPLPLLH